MDSGGKIDEITNQVNMMQTAEKFLNFCLNLIKEGVYETFLARYFELLHSKALLFRLNLRNFNFKLWSDLSTNLHILNYLSLSKSPNKAQKWLSLLLDAIPNIGDIFRESHFVFNKYKLILLPYSELFGIYETPNETDNEEAENIYDSDYLP